MLFSQMNLGAHFADALRQVLELDTAQTIVHLDLNNNNLGDKGAEIVAKAVKNSLSIVTLNLSSNTIGNAGMTSVFENLQDNISL